VTIDYVKAPLTFKIRKAARYVRLYGLNRTIWKVRGQYHMRRTFESLPQSVERGGKRHVGLLGCGNFGYSNIAYYLNKKYGRVMRGCMDRNIGRAASLFQDFKLDYYTDDAERILGDDRIDLVYIASNHASHAEYAIRALDEGKSVHIEKPHVVSFDQLERLCSAMSRSSGAVGLGFNRPNSRIGRLMRQALAAESGSTMLNWFIAGHEIDDDHWYFKKEEGGRVLGNLCHWTDLIYHCIPEEARYPITIRPTKTLKSDSDIAVTYTFGDGSIAALTFSAKGHTFEGVRERFAAHRGNVLVFMDDFQSLIIETNAEKRNLSSSQRDHGHSAAIEFSYDASRTAPDDPLRLPISYIWESGELFLKTKEALDTDTVQRVEAYSPDRLRQAAAEAAQ
jgi:predicted dehydrogenase